MSALTDAQAAQTSIESVVTELSAPTVPSVGDQVLEAIVPVLTQAGYTVTPPVVESESPTETEG
jgi:hypothetical protein